ncbi:MAG: sugar phosphate isomerase/epimerase [Bacteroidales bacterium]|nr:sugar phosphate isomerase/epimerase [Bacteroidales bacterium]
MFASFDRRQFLIQATGLGAAALLPSLGRADNKTGKDKLFQISLAQWSLNRNFFGRPGVEKLDPLQFAEIAHQQFGINAIEYVNQFYKAKKNDDAYLKELKKVADNHGVTSVLIMCDGEGNLGDPSDTKRTQAVANHKRWAEWAKFLGCHAIRVNAASDWNKGFAETQKLAADGLRKLTELCEPLGIAVIVENHGGLSSNGEWLAGVMKAVGHKNCGTLPDFGNFRISGSESYDKYKGVDELMPFAKGVSAKSHSFDDKGNETGIDYRKMLDIVVKKHKYRGFIGIEYEGSKHSPAEGIRLTKQLLETIRAELSER